jgi:hypothetical protein
MLTVSRRTPLALAGTLIATFFALAALAAPALAGAPATVTVRVLVPSTPQYEGYETLTPLATVTTTIAQVTKDGGSCPGTSAGGALELGTKGNWEGVWSSKYSDYEVISIDGKSYPFEPNSPANYYWSFWLNNKYEEKGICEAELEAGDQVLFFPSCYGASCPTAPGLLGIEAPTTAEVGKPVTVTVNRYNSEGKREPAAGVTVGGGGSSAETNSEGHVTLTLPGDDTYTLTATGSAGESPKSVPAEAFICAHEGNDGECGTHVPASGPSTQTPTSSTVTPPYTGPYALVADATGIHDGHTYTRKEAPRVLTGTVSAHASVTSISVRLRRTYHGRCWAYNGTAERLQRVHCRAGSFFQVASGGDSFSYLLPSRLPPGRYVLDIEATDAAGNHTPLDRGSSRIVFYVK